MWQIFDNGFFGDLYYYLIPTISAKQKLELPTAEEYSAYWTHERDIKILNDVNWRIHFENLTYLDFPSDFDVKVLHDSNNVNGFDLATFSVCLGMALKAYIDNFMENHNTAKIIKAYYDLIKNEMEFRSMDYPVGTYEDYLQSRIERHEEDRRLENARTLGDYCIYCGSENVRSYNKQEWKCYNCGKRFRKR